MPHILARKQADGSTRYTAVVRISSFVHGGRDVVHPMHNEAIDKRVDQSFRELADSAEFGFAVLLVCLQQTIERGCAELNFREIVDGSSLGKRTGN